VCHSYSHQFFARPGAVLLETVFQEWMGTWLLLAGGAKPGAWRGLRQLASTTMPAVI
jgi:hypothetical protein